MDNNLIDWDALPEVISKEQFYRICHISKTTARHLLVSGKVPCKNSGKKTRCYQIKKSDVQNYLLERDIYPETYSAPVGWYCSGRKKAAQTVPPAVLEDMHMYYTEQLQAYPDVMLTKDLQTFTGYAKATVNGWCSKGWLRYIRKGRANLTPKVFLVDFLCSLNFRAINQKSDLHRRMLVGFSGWRLERRRLSLAKH